MGLKMGCEIEWDARLFTELCSIKGFDFKGADMDSEESKQRVIATKPSLE